MSEHVVPDAPTTRWWSARGVVVLLVVGAALALVLRVVATGTEVPERGHPLANGLALTPPMGWNSWNTFGCDIDEAVVRREADALVSSGMRDAGYRYVVVDDCWFEPARDAAGDLRASSARFPHGMRALGDYLHARGLLFGLYESPSSQTCAQLAGAYPGSTGSRGHEVQDAARFAGWGVDYLKYDWCSTSGSTADQVRAFARMRDALAASGRAIVFSINPNSAHDTTGAERYWGDVANLWRTTQDITDLWTTGQSSDGPLGVQDIVDQNVPLAPLAAPGGWNDPDMLEVGRPGLTREEQRSHFALWAMMAAPLIAGNDVAHQDAATSALLRSRVLVSIDQDPLGRQAVQVAHDGTTRVLTRRLSGGRLAVALVNEGTTSRTIEVDRATLGLDGGRRVAVDAWTGRRSAVGATLRSTVPAHGTAVRVVLRAAG